MAKKTTRKTNTKKSIGNRKVRKGPQGGRYVIKNGKKQYLNRK